MKMGKFNIVFGGQAGSEGKGKMSAYLAYNFCITTFTACLSPNAGHSVVIGEHKWVTHHIPAGVIGMLHLSPPHTKVEVLLGPASVINPDAFLVEMESLNAEFGKGRLAVMIDSRAACITPGHVTSELRTMTRIGSTAQGVGEARSAKMMRRGILACDDDRLRPFLLSVPVWQAVQERLNNGITILHEMGQGFDLCLDHGIHPIYCTSRNCIPQTALAEMGVPIRFLGDTYAVIRTYPIRVNNREGSSGPYPSSELTWDEIRRRCHAPHDITELTSTTKLKRRVFEFSPSRIIEMVKVCDPTFLCLQFVNYIDWDCYGLTMKEMHKSHQERRTLLPPSVFGFVQSLTKFTGKPVAYLGTGSDHAHMLDFGLDKDPLLVPISVEI